VAISTRNHPRCISQMKSMKYMWCRYTLQHVGTNCIAIFMLFFHAELLNECKLRAKSQHAIGVCLVYNVVQGKERETFSIICLYELDIPNNTTLQASSNKHDALSWACMCATTVKRFQFLMDVLQYDLAVSWMQLGWHRRWPSNYDELTCTHTMIAATKWHEHDTKCW